MGLYGGYSIWGYPMEGISMGDPPWRGNPHNITNNGKIIAMWRAKHGCYAASFGRPPVSWRAYTKNENNLVGF